MKRTKELKTNKGITLIALVITIIVMLILVGVTISVAVNGGLFEQAGKAASKTNEALKAEEELSNGKIQIGDDVYNSIEEYVNKYKGDNVEKISKETSFVGYYADVDGDKIADGIIYADLALAKEGYYEAETGLKDYYVSGTYHGDFDENGKEVLTATGEGKERFYVMALSDISESQYAWYTIVWEEGGIFDTVDSFGSGKRNTETMIGIWNADTDGQNSQDLWGHIQTQVGKGWFLPSVKEWETFLQEIDVTKVVEKEDELGSWEEEICLISNEYWTSVGGEFSDAYYVMPYNEEKYGTFPADSVCNVRLSTCF